MGSRNFWKPVMIILAAVLVLAVGYRFSERFGAEAVRSYKYASLINIAAAVFGLVPKYLFGRYDEHEAVAGLLSGGAVRLFTAFSGMVLALFWAKVELKWFLAWMIVMYVIVLFFETWLGMRTIQKMRFTDSEYNEAE